MQEQRYVIVLICTGILAENLLFFQQYWGNQLILYF